MKKLSLFLALLACAVSVVGAQERTITGQVIFADDNEPIIGATILVPTSTATLPSGFPTRPAR